MQRLLFLDQYGDMGGGQRILLDLAEGAAASGFSVTVLCPEGPLHAILGSKNIETHNLRIPPMRDGRKTVVDLLRSFALGRKEAARCRKLADQADVIVVNGMRALPVALQWNKPTLLYLHGIYRGMQRRFVRSALRKSRFHAIAPSTLVAEAIGMRETITVVENWVSPEFLTKPVIKDSLRLALGIEDSLPIILVPGRISVTKGQPAVLDALNFTTEKFHLVFTGRALFERGGGAVVDIIRERETANPLIHYHPWDGSMTLAYDDADLVIVPSVWEEPFGLTAIEAMARLRPLIVSSRGTLPAIVEKGMLAEVVEPTPEGIAHAINAFFRNGDIWRARAVAAKEKVLRAYHPDANRATVYALIRRMAQ